MLLSSWSHSQNSQVLKFLARFKGVKSSLIPWFVNPSLQYKSSIFGNVNLKWYISRSFKGQRRFLLWALTKTRSILRPYNSDFLLTTTCFILSWIMMNEMGVSSHKGKYSGHLKLSCLHITWQLFWCETCSL